MVDVDVHIEIESSNGAGFLALMKDVPIADMTRWIGAGGIHPQIPPATISAWTAATVYTALTSWALKDGVVYQCVTSHTASASNAPSATIAFDHPNDRITLTAHGYPNGMAFRLVTTDTLPAGVKSGTTYYVVETINTNDFQFAATPGGAPVLIADNGTGTHTLMPSGTWRTLSSLRNYDVRIPKARILTPRRPFSNNVSREIIKATPTTIDYVGGAPSASAKQDSWVYVRSNSTGQGNLRKLSATATATTATTAEKFAPPISAPDAGNATDGAVHFLLDSHTISGANTTRRITKTGNTDALTSAIVGKQVLFFGNEYTFTTTHGENLLTILKHGFSSGLRLRLKTTGGLPAGLFGGLDYYVLPSNTGIANWSSVVSYIAGNRVVQKGVIYECVNPNLNDPPPSANWSSIAVVADTFKLALSAGGAEIDFTSNGSGTHTLTLFSDLVYKVAAFVDGTNFDVDRDLPLNMSGGFCILSGAGSCNSVAEISSTTCMLADATLYVDENGPVWLTGGESNYDTTPFQNPRTAYGGGVTGPTINLTLENQFHWRSRSQNIVIIKMGVSASMISPFLNGQVFGPTTPVSFAGFLGWFYGISSLDFHPSSPNALYAALTAQITAAIALIKAEGNTPRFREILINLFDNDPVDEQRQLRLAANAILLRDAVRIFVGDHTVPCTLSGPSTYGGVQANRDILYEFLRAAAAADPAGTSGVTDTQSNTNKAIDGLHYNAVGQILLAQQNFATWDPIFTRLVEDVNAANSMAIEISNISLSLLGETAKVFSLDTTIDLSTQALLCAQFYPVALQTIREQHAWAFATRTVSLVVATKDDVRTDWAFAYLLPPDMDTPLKVVVPGMTVTSNEIPPWWRTPDFDPLLMKEDDPDYAIEQDNQGRRVLYCNVENAQLRYTARMSSKTVVPRSFKTAVARKLAALLAGPIVKGDRGMTLSKEFEMMSRFELNEAASIDSNHQQKQPPADRMPWSRG